MFINMHVHMRIIYWNKMLIHKIYFNIYEFVLLILLIILPSLLSITKI